MRKLTLVFGVYSLFVGKRQLACKHRNIKSNKNPQLSHTRDQVQINSTDNRKTNRVIKNGIKGCVFDLLKTYTGKHPSGGP